MATATGTRRAQYAVLAYTGLRADEMRMLRPQDVDMKRGWVHVGGWPGWVPKTRQARKVPVHPLLVTYLGAYTGGPARSAPAALGPSSSASGNCPHPGPA